MIDIYNKLISSIYLFIYSILLFFSIISVSNLNSPRISLIFNVIILITFCVNVVFLVIKHSFIKDIVPLLFLFIYLILFLFLKIKIVPLFLLLAYILYKNSDFINIKWFVRCNLLITSLTFIGVVILNLFGKIPSIAVDLPGVNKGYTLGFTHPDGTGAIVISIISSIFIYASYLLIRYKENHRLILMSSVGLSLILTLIFYPLTQCKELLFFEIIIIVFMLLYKYRKKIYIYLFMVPISILFPAITVYFNYKFNPLNKFYYGINNMLSGRLSMQQSVLINYPIHLFQSIYTLPNLQALKIEKGSTILIDNSYVSILEYFGVVGILISAIFLFCLLYHSIKYRYYIISVMIIAIILCTSVQSTLFYVYLDGPLIYSGILYSKKLRLKHLR